jgi:hypothetical protein
VADVKSSPQKNTLASQIATLFAARDARGSPVAPEHFIASKNLKRIVGSKELALMLRESGILHRFFDLGQPGGMTGPSLSQISDSIPSGTEGEVNLGQFLIAAQAGKASLRAMPSQPAVAFVPKPPQPAVAFVPKPLPVVASSNCDRINVEMVRALFAASHANLGHANPASYLSQEDLNTTLDSIQLAQLLKKANVLHRYFDDSDKYGRPLAKVINSLTPSVDGTFNLGEFLRSAVQPRGQTPIQPPVINRLFAAAELDPFGHAAPSLYLNETQMSMRLSATQVAALLKDAGVLHRYFDDSEKKGRSIRKVVGSLNPNPDGTINLGEFLIVALAPRSKSSEHFVLEGNQNLQVGVPPQTASILLQLFSTVDVSDGAAPLDLPSGFMNIDEMQLRLDSHALETLITETGGNKLFTFGMTVASLMTTMNADKDGKVSLAEFLNFARNAIVSDRTTQCVAATKIQANFRGHRARKLIAKYAAAGKGQKQLAVHAAKTQVDSKNTNSTVVGTDLQNAPNSTLRATGSKVKRVGGGCIAFMKAFSTREPDDVVNPSQFLNQADLGIQLSGRAMKVLLTKAGAVEWFKLKGASEGNEADNLTEILKAAEAKASHSQGLIKVSEFIDALVDWNVGNAIKPTPAPSGSLQTAITTPPGLATNSTLLRPLGGASLVSLFSDLPDMNETEIQQNAENQAKQVASEANGDAALVAQMDEAFGKPATLASSIAEVQSIDTQKATAHNAIHIGATPLVMAKSVVSNIAQNFDPTAATGTESALLKPGRAPGSPPPLVASYGKLPPKHDKKAKKRAKKVEKEAARVLQKRMKRSQTTDNSPVVTASLSTPFSGFASANTIPTNATRDVSREAKNSPGVAGDEMVAVVQTADDLWAELNSPNTNLGGAGGGGHFYPGGESTSAPDHVWTNIPAV